MFKNSITILFLLISTTYLVAQVDSLLDYYEKGKEAYYDGNYDTAERLFLKNLDYQQKHADTGRNIIKAYTRLGDVYRKKRIFKKSLQNYAEAIALSKIDLEKYSDEYITAIQNRSIVYSKMYEPLNAIQEINKLLPIVEKESTDYANLLMNNGLDYFKMDDYYLAETIFLEALDVFKKKSKPDSEDFNRIYTNLGITYLSMGDYPKALDYAEKALEIKLKNYEPNHQSVAKYYANIGSAHDAMGNPQKALPYFEKALTIEKMAYSDDHPDVIGIKGDIGGLYEELGQYDLAMEYYKSVFQLDTTFMDDTHPYIISFYSSIAEIYLKKGQFDDALQTLNLALNKMTRRAYIPVGRISDLHALESEIYFQKGESETAIKILINAIRDLDTNFKSKDEFDLPNSKNVADKKRFIELTTQLIRFFEKNENTNLIPKKRYELALNVAENAIQTVNDLRISYHSNEARRYLNMETQDLFKAAVRIAFQLYEMTNHKDFLYKAFQFAEDAKANLIKQTINDGLTLRSADIPSVLLDSLDKLKYKIGGIEDELNDMKIDINENIVDKKSKKHIDSLETEKILSLENYDVLIRFFEKNYPKYFQLKFGNQKLDINAIQKRLSTQNTTMISYFIDDDHVYIFLLNAFDFVGYKSKIDSNLTDLLTSIRSFLNPKAVLTFDSALAIQWEKSLKKLSDLIIKPVWKNHLFEVEKGHSLVILPHGVLHYLPFEILHASGDNSFLIEKMPIYYANSASLWVTERINTRNKKANRFAGFAPSYDNLQSDENQYSGFANLHWNLNEVKKANQFFDGNIFTGKEATEQNFRKIAPQSTLLHLAMHADLNEKWPMRSGLIFTPQIDSVEDGFLNLYEVYNLDLNSQMVIMNACNTGNGKLAAGEGVLSLSNAFAYSGCESILHNLWLADDQSTAEIITDFLKNWKQGMPQPEALRQAKLEFLENADPLRKRPYFWAGLVLQGNVIQSSNHGWMFWGSLIFVCLIVSWIFRKRIRSIGH